MKRLLTRRLCVVGRSALLCVFEQRNEASDGDGAIAGNRKMRDG